MTTINQSLTGLDLKTSSVAEASGPEKEAELQPDSLDAARTSTIICELIRSSSTDSSIHL